MKKFVIVLTGQERTFWKTWENLREMILDPVRGFGYEVVLGVCTDREFRGRGRVWESEDERHGFVARLEAEWEAWNGDGKRLYHLWVDRTDPLFAQAIWSLDTYRKNNVLTPEWRDYLVRRSGSCIEYVQFSRIHSLLEEAVAGGGGEDDLLFRTRTDILFRHPINIPPDVSKRIVEVSELFPGAGSGVFARKEQGRESSFFPSRPFPGRWIITLRKNLVFLLPFCSSSILREVAPHYGDWDHPDENRYWFNAESQFRGCLRHHCFTIVEFSQSRDECFGDFATQSDTLPVYAIQR
jgi:hypothetical protein